MHPSGVFHLVTTLERMDEVLRSNRSSGLSFFALKIWVSFFVIDLFFPPMPKK